MGSGNSTKTIILLWRTEGEEKLLDYVIHFEKKICKQSGYIPSKLQYIRQKQSKLMYFSHSA